MKLGTSPFKVVDSNLRRLVSCNTVTEGSSVQKMKKTQTYFWRKFSSCNKEVSTGQFRDKYRILPKVGEKAWYIEDPNTHLRDGNPKFTSDHQRYM